MTLGDINEQDLQHVLEILFSLPKTLSERVLILLNEIILSF